MKFVYLIILISYIACLQSHNLNKASIFEPENFLKKAKNNRVDETDINMLNKNKEQNTQYNILKDRDLIATELNKKKDENRIGDLDYRGNDEKININENKIKNEIDIKKEDGLALSN
jgi:hypothetical protein